LLVTVLDPPTHTQVQRLIPDPGETTVERQLDAYRPWEEPRDGRPFVAANFAVTLDGRATIGGTSGAIGSDTDTAMLIGLRGRFDAVMIGAGTMRAERYGNMVPRQEVRDAREALGLPPAPLMVLVSGRLDLPWDAPLFADDGRILIFTSAETEPPETTADLRVVHHEGSVDLVAALLQLRDEYDIRALLCEGGPRLHGQLWAAGLVDELFLTMSPRLTGGDGPSIVEGQALPEIAELQLAWLLEESGELFARYRHR
jgi:riboflavin-specific deaminase-like protein